MLLPERMKKIILLGVFLSFLAACTGIEGKASMQVWLDSPLDGSSFQVGETVQIHTHARDVNGPGIDEFHYFANDRLLAIGETDASLPLVHSFICWNPTEAGLYDLYTKAVSVSGATMESVHITVTISEQQYKEMGPGADASSTPTITRPPVTPTLTTTQKIPTLTPSLTRTLYPTNTITQRPPEVNLSASVTFLYPGQCTSLSWETVNTTSVTLNDLPVTNYSGSTTRCPLTNVTYTLVGYYPGGSVSDSVSITVEYGFPDEEYSVYVGLSITDGHESIHYLGEYVELCYNYIATSRLYVFEFREYAPATPGSEGATGSYTVLAEGNTDEPGSNCINRKLNDPYGYKAYQFRLMYYLESPTPILEDFAEVWIYVYP